MGFFKGAFDAGKMPTAARTRFVRRMGGAARIDHQGAASLELSAQMVS